MVKRRDTQKRDVLQDSSEDNSDPHQEDSFTSYEDNVDSLKTHKTRRGRGDKPDKKRHLPPLPR